MENGFPERGYVLCSEHRSGSTWLCQLLRSTGVLGRPDEYFRHTEFSIRLEREPQLLNETIAAASSPNGVYGLKVFSQQFDATSKARWMERLPNLHFIHLERRDLLGQAISLVRALQTWQYMHNESARSQPSYDGKAIARHLARLAEAHARWRRYFARNGIKPLWLTYEEIVADPAAALEAVARHIGVRGPLAVDASQVDLAVQRDSVSEAWRDRFVRESADLTYLDHPLGRPRIWVRRAARDAGHMLRTVKRRLR